MGVCMAGLHPGGLHLDGGGVCMWVCMAGLHPGGLHLEGVCIGGGGIGQTPGPPVNRMTDRCKNITFANFVCGR